MVVEGGQQFGGAAVADHAVRRHRVEAGCLACDSAMPIVAVAEALDGVAVSASVLSKGFERAPLSSIRTRTNPPPGAEVPDGLGGRLDRHGRGPARTGRSSSEAGWPPAASTRVSSPSTCSAVHSAR